MTDATQATNEQTQRATAPQERVVPTTATQEQVVQTLVGALQVLAQHVNVTPALLLGAINVLRLEQETVLQTNILEIVNANRRAAMIEQVNAEGRAEMNSEATADAVVAADESQAGPVAPVAA